ncbi:MAG TPA: ABC transporter permease [Vicinamibacterales bacterium]|nr:ABC transporter permease [Vicinamibacterales bacterium]
MALVPTESALSPWQIEPREQGVTATAREVWAHRRFMSFLAVRALRKMYARTALGWLWLFITPLWPVLLRAIVFGGLIGMTGEGIPYFLFLLVGSVLWDFFASGLMWGTRGLELHRNVLEHVYLPRVIMPLATMAPALLDLVLISGVLALAAVYYLAVDGRMYLTLGAPTLLGLVALLMTTVLAFGIGLFTAVWGETARDARFTMGQVLLVWFLLTPILYPMSAVPAHYRPWMLLNPLAAFVETFKWSLLGVGRFDAFAFGLAVALSVSVVLLGLLFFSRIEVRRADDN